MQINNNPSFGARRISIEMITKNATKNGKKTRKPMEASFIKLNTNSFYDKKVLKTISDKWGGSFAEDIYIDATNVFEKDITKGGIYAITTQKKGFTQVEPKKILGLIELSLDMGNNMYIEYLQAKPQIINSPSRNISNIGKALISGIFREFKGSLITVAPVNSKRVLHFYNKNGFKRSPEYRWIYEHQA